MITVKSVSTEDEHDWLESNEGDILEVHDD